MCGWSAFLARMASEKSHRLYTHHLRVQDAGPPTRANGPSWHMPGRLSLGANTGRCSGICTVFRNMVPVNPERYKCYMHRNRRYAYRPLHHSGGWNQELAVQSLQHGSTRKERSVLQERSLRTISQKQLVNCMCLCRILQDCRRSVHTVQ